MKYVYHCYMVHSNKKNQDYYYISLDLVDDSGATLFKGSPILWIDEKAYKELLNVSK